MRLIDADALKQLIAEHVYPVQDAFNSRDYGMFWTVGIEKAIDEIPTVDAVAVVRCKDCRHYLNSAEKCGLIDTRLHFYETDKRWTEDCFCSWGERRSE